MVVVATPFLSSLTHFIITHTITHTITAFVQMVVLFLSHQLNEVVWSAWVTHVERFADAQTNQICVQVSHIVHSIHSTYKCDRFHVTTKLLS